MTRYVVYCRYSSDLQSPESLEDQKRKCREYADREGWTEVRAYEDAAISGTGMDRHGFQRLMADSASPTRDFDVILIDDTSRLSRSLVDSVNLHQRLAYYGVRVIAVSQGINTQHGQSELLIAMHGITDSLYVKELAKKTHRGLEGKFLNGLSAGGRCFGYLSVPVEGGGARWAIDLAEDKIVREIFELSAAGRSLKGIARLLNERSRLHRSVKIVPTRLGALRPSARLFGENFTSESGFGINGNIPRRPGPTSGLRGFGLRANGKCRRSQSSNHQR